MIGRIKSFCTNTAQRQKTVPSAVGLARLCGHVRLKTASQHRDGQTGRTCLDVPKTFPCMPTCTQLTRARNDYTAENAILELSCGPSSDHRGQSAPISPTNRQRPRGDRRLHWQLWIKRYRPLRQNAKYLPRYERNRKCNIREIDTSGKIPYTASTKNVQKRWESSSR
jgi:hypothetical protein